MEKKREWLVFGILILPLVFLVSLLVGIVTKNYVLWLTLPGILLEQMFERCCSEFAGNKIANFIFAIFLWFIIGAAIGKTAFFSTMFKKGTAQT